MTLREDIREIVQTFCVGAKGFNDKIIDNATDAILSKFLERLPSRKPGFMLDDYRQKHPEEWGYNQALKDVKSVIAGYDLDNPGWDTQAGEDPKQQLGDK